VSGVGVKYYLPVPLFFALFFISFPNTQEFIAREFQGIAGRRQTENCVRECRQALRVSHRVVRGDKSPWPVLQSNRLVEGMRVVIKQVKA
jgi:hypothetical protein